MGSNEPDILAVSKGTITAPAGCGKTHLIATGLKRHESKLPILVLTHTNAGVAALRARLDKAGVKPSRYRLATIDGWAIRLINMFPARSGFDISMGPENRQYYPTIRQAAIKLLSSGDINDCVEATYSRLIVDEYQDCSIAQHAIVCHIASILPTCVLGDPLQAIFGFGGDLLPDWNKVVCTEFPVATELNTPWRWNNVGSNDFGMWLLDARKKLLNRERISFDTAPKNLIWVQLDGNDDYNRQLKAAHIKPATEGGSVLIIGDSRRPASQHELASHVKGAVTVENVDLRDFTEFARRLDFNSPKAIDEVINFASRVMTGINTEAFMGRLRTLQTGKQRKEASDAELVALKFNDSANPKTAAWLLSELSRQVGTRTYRQVVLSACIRALNACDMTPGNTFAEVAVKVREQSRALGRPLPKRAVGSTLLLKGLEADTAVIIDVNFFDHARHTYVAMTRGSHQLVVCSQEPYI